MDFCGNWKNNNKIISIERNDKVFTCSLPRKSIGMLFNHDLVASEFDDSVQSAGIGVYSPIGDGSSYYALWSSIGVMGQLGSGIALKCDGTTGFDGAFDVRYFLGGNEDGSFSVEIKRIENEGIFKLSWFTDNKKVFHGIGFLIEHSLAFAWGVTDCKFNFSRFCYHVNNGTEKLTRQMVAWDSVKIESEEFSRA